MPSGAAVLDQHRTMRWCFSPEQTKAVFRTCIHAFGAYEQYVGVLGGFARGCIRSDRDSIVVIVDLLVVSREEGNISPV